MLSKILLTSYVIFLSFSAFAEISQVSSHLEIIKVHNSKMDELVKKAILLRESIGSNSNFKGSLECSSGNVPSIFKGRCDELVSVVNKFKELDTNVQKLKALVSAVDRSAIFTKMILDKTPLMSTVVTKSTKDIYEMDKVTPDCNGVNLKGWKCWYTKITTIEGKTYNIALKWNRPNIASRGTILTGSGGAGMGESRDNPPSKDIMDQVSEVDNMRIVALEMMDPDLKNMNMSGGYWVHAGGYKTLAQIFNAVVELAVEKNLLHGSFTNYFGGSNGSMLAASGFSLYDLDIYFARAIFQMGPFFPNLQTACDQNSASRVTLSSIAQQMSINELLGIWTYHDPSRKVCDNMKEDRTSILKDGKKEYPNTRIHVIMGAKETTDGFGSWILASNLEWFNSIRAKSKERIIRSYMAHNNSYEDMRRFMRLGPDDVAQDENAECTKGSFDENGTKVDYSCGCGLVEGGSIQLNGCFHKVAEKAPSNQDSSGFYCAPNGTQTKWICGVDQAPGDGWVKQGDGCFHQGTSTNCK